MNVKWVIAPSGWSLVLYGVTLCTLSKFGESEWRVMQSVGVGKFLPTMYFRGEMGSTQAACEKEVSTVLAKMSEMLQED